ncbi:MAG: 30S ribosomal protein S9 [Candidatus Harrisonbacteria bacterium CG10_big_fil_rev_8_21_14_0_10_42_17]|uniref:Small ribosomal subunit protein uS9 n=1 Tax=Candidatus Harrisonbacteria bacterium CG10_big_fil_rev_8_21_14_0_10_42_17 TaxID=1974584 RepID=A0A2M6WHU9_9BACT|nr:MAG: 30S ribosomal protein S9 [Candidatus Harrisonbacteria bacterium CG10_big_fil_rev_8_21_14_0_10_42_17]
MTEKAEKYIESKGGRKTAIARVRITEKKGGITINDKDLKEYFRDTKSQNKVKEPLKLLSIEETTTVSVRVKGSGIKAQAEAVRNGLAKALVAMNPENRKKLKKSGFLTRDSRVVERKKPGLKKARRAPQWSKR